MQSVYDSQLYEEFEMFGVDLKDEFCPKLQELRVQFHLNEGQVVSEWMAFICSRNVSSMNLATLEKFEKEWLPKRASKIPKLEEKHVVESSFGNRIGDEDVDIISMYACSTPTDRNKNTGKRQVAPDERDALRKRLADSERSPVVPKPTSYANSPGVSKTTPTSSRFAERTAAGEAVVTFGVQDSKVWKGSVHRCTVTPFDSAHVLDNQFKYMFLKLSEKANVLNGLIENMEEFFTEHFTFEDLAPIGQPTQEVVHVVGRVACDSLGKLNRQSVILEGSRSTSSGCSIPIDLSELDAFALFPGQVIAADAINITGKKLLIKKIYQPKQQPFPQPIVKSEAVSRLSVVVAAGPFSTSDNLQYDPLQALLEKLHHDCPDVCILIGPFVDIRNAVIESGQMNESYDDTFQKCMALIAEDTKNLNCQIVVVPSSRDAHHHSVYPQGPFAYADKPQHLHFYPDPCTLNINNIVFGITSTDILFHLSAEEIAVCAPGSADRLGRLAQHLLDQHSYYPLYPSSEDVNADMEYFKEGVWMTVTPHVLICPSDLRYFIKDCSGCCCVNPGRLAKGQIGGTYARLLLQSPASSQPTSLLSTTAGQILHI